MKECRTVHDYLAAMHTFYSAYAARTVFVVTDMPGLEETLRLEAIPVRAVGGGAVVLRKGREGRAAGAW